MKWMLAALWLVVAPELAEFDEMVEQARVHFEAERYGEAAAALARAHALEPQDDVLLNWANAERLAGQCVDAVPLYDQYMDNLRARPELDELSSRYLDVAQQHRDECAATLPEEPPEPEPVIAPVEPGDGDPEPKPEPIVTEDDPGEPAEPHIDAKPPKRDPWGWALTGVGLGAIGAGTSMVAVAYARDANALDQPSHGAYLERVEGSARLSVAGWSVLGVGAALTIAGVVRLVAVRRRARQVDLRSSAVVVRF